LKAKGGSAAAVDARWYFVGDAGSGVTVTHIAISLGYDRF